MNDLPAVPSALPDLPQFVQQYLNGESIQSLAQQHRCSHRVIYKWLLKECGPQYDEVVTDALIARIADADQQLEEATTPIQIARAREMAKFSRMDFERRRPKLYGPKQELQHDHTVNIIVNRSFNSGVLPSPPSQPIDVIPTDIMEDKTSG